LLSEESNKRLTNDHDKQMTKMERNIAGEGVFKETQHRESAHHGSVK
jgi:hypothetical protein